MLFFYFIFSVNHFICAIGKSHEVVECGVVMCQLKPTLKEPRDLIFE